MLNQLWSLGLTKQHFKGISTSVRVQRAFIWKTHSVPRSVPLNPPALMYHIVAPFSTVIPTLSPSPMEVIKRALFMLDHCTSEGLGITTAMSHMQTPLRVTGDDSDQPEIHRIHCGVSCATRTKTMTTPRQSWEGCPTGTALLAGVCNVQCLINAIYRQALVCRKQAPVKCIQCRTNRRFSFEKPRQQTNVWIKHSVSWTQANEDTDLSQSFFFFFCLLRHRLPLSTSYSSTPLAQVTVGRLLRMHCSTSPSRLNEGGVKQQPCHYHSHKCVFVVCVGGVVAVSVELYIFLHAAPGSVKDELFPWHICVMV